MWRLWALYARLDISVTMSDARLDISVTMSANYALRLMIACGRARHMYYFFVLIPLS